MKKALVVLLTLGLVAMIVVPAAANLKLDTQVPPNQLTVSTTATITSATGSAPIVKKQWEIVDEDLTTPGVQINIVPSGTKWLKSYSVIRDPNGRDDIVNVYVDVYHPDGTFKYQRHAVKVTDPLEIENALNKGVESGELTAAQKTELLEELGNLEDAYMYVADLDMDYHQIHGKYKVACWATDRASNNGAKLDSYFWWVKTPVLEIDFEDGIDFGEITPCVEKMIAGDYTIDVPPDPTPFFPPPSVKNEGNCELKLSVKSKRMIGTTNTKIITDFDTKLADPNGIDEQKILYSAPADGSWSALQTFNFPLRLCHTDKICFSAHAQLGLPSDTYTGELNISAVPW